MLFIFLSLLGVFSANSAFSKKSVSLNEYRSILAKQKIGRSDSDKLKQFVEENVQYKCTVPVGRNTCFLERPAIDVTLQTATKDSHGKDIQQEAAGGSLRVMAEKRAVFSEEGGKLGTFPAYKYSMKDCEDCRIIYDEFVVNGQNGKFGQIEQNRFSTDKLNWKDSKLDNLYTGERVKDGRATIDQVAHLPNSLMVYSNFIVCDTANKCRKLDDLILASDTSLGADKLWKFSDWPSLNKKYDTGLNCSYKNEDFTCNDKNGPIKSRLQEYKEMNDNEFQRLKSKTDR